MQRYCLWARWNEVVRICSDLAKPYLFKYSANHARKGLDKLLQAYKAVEEQTEDSFLIIHSQPNGYYSLEKHAKKLKIERLWLTKLFGRITTVEVNALYKACTVYVQPSFSEGFGLPILEAFRFDKPAIAVNAPPFNEVIKHTETGILVPPDAIRWFNFKNLIDFKMHTYRTEDLAHTIVQCVTDRKLLASMESKIGTDRIYLCHCTGVKATTQLRKVFGKSCNPVHAGDTIELG